MTNSHSISLAIHGGAGQYDINDESEQIEHLRGVMTEGRIMLLDGVVAIDVAESLATLLEDSGHYVAGKGTAPNSAGEYELDACLMNGANRRIGAVCALKGYKNPIRVARKVLDHTPHVMLAGRGAENFASAQDCEQILKPLDYYIIKGITRSPGDLDTGTIGVVARDLNGHLAAATSTGGLLGKMQGRVGDSPLPGAGCWADERVAVSCTGQGEYFVKAATAADVSARVRYGGYTLQAASAGAIHDMGLQGGYGGLIALGRSGEPVFPYNSKGMRRGWIDANGDIHATV